MPYLILAVLASVSVSVLLKIARKQNFAIDHAIAMNYLVACACCWLFLRPSFEHNGALFFSHWPIFVALGVLLPAVFIIMGKAVADVGIVKSDAAQRLSLFLPIIAAFTLFHEPLTAAKATGIALAFTALCALVYGGKSASSSVNTLRSMALLFGVWVGYGVIDILFKQMAKVGAGFPLILFISFVLAGTAMFTYLFLKGSRWSMRDVVAGVILGGLNFANILFYIRAHAAIKDDPSLVFAGMNLGVICLGTAVGTLFFGERIRRINAVGIVLAIIAIVVLFYGESLRARLF